MKVLVINPPNMPFTDKNLLIEPIDDLTLATYIRELGHEVKLLDMDVLQKGADSIKQQLRSFKPDFTAIVFDYHIPLFTSEAIAGVNLIARHAQESGSKVIIGGRPSNHYPESFLADTEAVIIEGEMEPALLELLNEDVDPSSVPGIIYREATKIIKTGKRGGAFDIDTLPMPDRSFVNLDDYIDVRTILTSRGCVGKCGFCPVPEFFGRWRGRSPKNVVSEISHLVNGLKAKKILFLDDNATVSKERMQKISDEITGRGIKTTMGCLGSVAHYDEKTVRMMHSAGFRWIHYGAEILSQKSLDYLRKDVTVSQIKKAIIGTRKAGLRVRASFIFDAPKAIESEIDDTIDFILKNEPDEIRPHYMTLRVGTKEFEKKKESFSKIPPQYIHRNMPHSSFDTIDPKLIVKKVEYMTDGLAKKGFIVIREPKEWKDVKQSDLDDEGCKIISFCPLKYGIGWKL